MDKISEKRPWMQSIGFFSIIKRACAEDTVRISKNVLPNDVVHKLSTRFAIAFPANGVMTLRRKSFFSATHYLEMKVVNKYIECNLRVGDLDRAIAAIFLVFINAFPIVGGAILATAEVQHDSAGTVSISFFAGAGVLDLFLIWLYRLLRWLSGMSNPEAVLAAGGIAISDD